jgi:hypothetical protein
MLRKWFIVVLTLLPQMVFGAALNCTDLMPGGLNGQRSFRGRVAASPAPRQATGWDGFYYFYYCLAFENEGHWESDRGLKVCGFKDRGSLFPGIWAVIPCSKLSHII